MDPAQESVYVNGELSAFPKDRHLDCSHAEPAQFNTKLQRNASKKQAKEKKKQLKEVNAEIRKIVLVLLGESGSGKFELGEKLAQHQDETKQAIASLHRQVRLPSPTTLIAPGGGLLKGDDVFELAIRVVPADSKVSQFLTAKNSEPTSNDSSKSDCEILLLCIAVNSPDAIKKIISHWLPQLCEPCLVKTPLIVVGTQRRSLANNPSGESNEPLARSPSGNRNVVAFDRAQNLAKWIGAIGYVESPTTSEPALAQLDEMIAAATNIKHKEQRRQMVKRMSSLTENLEQTALKIVLVGDGACGKNCLAVKFSTGNFPHGPYEPTPFEQYPSTTLFSSGARILDVPVELRVTSGINPRMGTIDYHNRLRGLSYKNADAVLLCFAIDQVDAISRLTSYWLPEIKSLCPRVPIILVATKVDLRTDPETLQLLSEMRQAPISREVGEATAKQIGAAAYVECSARSGDDVNEVVEAAVKAVLENDRYQQKHCFLM